jgi:hypothetical protein
VSGRGAAARWALSLRPVKRTLKAVERRDGGPEKSRKSPEKSWHKGCASYSGPETMGQAYAREENGRPPPGLRRTLY